MRPFRVLKRECSLSHLRSYGPTPRQPGDGGDRLSETAGLIRITAWFGRITPLVLQLEPLHVTHNHRKDLFRH